MNMKTPLNYLSYPCIFTCTFISLIAINGTVLATDTDLRASAALRTAVNNSTVQAESVLIELSKQALDESVFPVRPGIPGSQPFWNKMAVQFSYAPAFDFKEVPGAESYRFTVVTETGNSFDFMAEKPWAALSPIWAKVPTGKVTLHVAALDTYGAAIGEPMTRTFHRAAVFGRETPSPTVSWPDSARTALDKLVHSPDLKCWFTTGEPDVTFDLYRYPGKIIGAAASVLAIYAMQNPPPADAAEALTAARRAADYLLSLCEPKSSAWAFHPPTYHPTLFRELLKRHMGKGYYMSNTGAETGWYFLDVYAATQDGKYLEAAIRIAETYEKQQLPEGSWLLFVTPKDGKPATANVLIPTYVVEFLDMLQRVTNDHRFDAMREKAIVWIKENPVRTWNWQGQFEDVLPTPPYDNLTKHEACDFAIYLLKSNPLSPADKELALDLLRFAEDQYVMWAQPPEDAPNKQNEDGTEGSKSKRWTLPCVVEQYRCYAPVCASSAKLISTYIAAWHATHDRIFLEKAKALASTLTRTQANAKAPGRYLTWLMQPSGRMWFNCELMAIKAMQELAVADQSPVQ
jgi:hypothetical protein